MIKSFSRRRLWIALAVGALLMAAGAGYLRYIGYLGGPVFYEVAPTGTPPAKSRGLVAVIVSGDMGFRVGMAPKLAKRFAADGVPVEGVSSLAYFRTTRTPAEVQALIASAIRRGLAFGHADRVVLIGQSFGADMVHVGLTGLPPELRAKVKFVGLVVPTDTVYFTASPSELFTFAKPDAQALPTGRLLTWVPVTCIHGELETDSLCPMLHQPNLKSVALPGNHFLHYDDAAVYGALRSAIANITDL